MAKTTKPKTKDLDPNDLYRLEAEKQVDDEVATRTSRYDQDLKERARTYGINPDNFATEEALGATVKQYEDDNGILGTPEERDQ